MVWSYSGNPAELTEGLPKDAVRLTIGDTESSDPLLSDEEILWLYRQEGDLTLAAIACCQVIRAKLSRLVDFSADGTSMQLSQRVKHYAALEEELRTELSYTAIPYAGGLLVDEKTSWDANTADVQPAFRRDGSPDTENDETSL